ncbi:MAG TPA: prolyl oligopeptidase family serine peptidase, partial [Candidatus Dormibacteraeota bacterium]|nr:prolyl oligopeptidase family serine peptidase [Candidatus Dormibacteraeota bacterium]
MGARVWLRRLCAGAIVGLGLALVPSGVAAGTVTTINGTAADGSQYRMEVPSPWNGTLLLYSHGYEFGAHNPLIDAPLGTRDFLLGNGYALAASTYSTTGWALEQAFTDQTNLVGLFDSTFGTPERTIAWGHSLGGMITAGLVQLFPDRFTAALPMCGVVAGGPGVWNQGLDSVFALKTLTGGAYDIVNFTPQDVLSEFNAAFAGLVAAQGTPQGRARIALSAALADVPGWFNPASPEPAAADFTTQELNQFQWDTNPDFAFAFFGRLELEQRARGNFSWNTGVDYRVQLSHSVDLAEVK